MAFKSRKSEKANKKTPVERIDNRSFSVPKDPPIDPKIANAPVRTVNFVEVKDMPRENVQVLINEVSKAHKLAEGGIHYIIPIRHGKITSDILFEEEWLKVVRDTCEIEDGEIVLKGGAKDVNVIRRTL